MFKKNIIYRLYIDVKYLASMPSTYSGVILDVNSTNEKKTITFQKNFITLDMIDMIKFVYLHIGLENIKKENIFYKENYENYLNETKQFHEKKYKNSYFKIPVPKNIKNKEDIKWLYLLRNNEYIKNMTKGVNCQLHFEK